MAQQDPSHRAFKDGLYNQFARIGKTLASPHRIELLDLLAQGERSVEALAEETGLSVANVSQHLRTMRGAGLIESRKQGLFVHYRLAHDSVYGLYTALRKVADERLADLERLVREHFGNRTDPEPVAIEDLLERMHSRRVVVLDVRPPLEYRAGHIAGALSYPVDELKRRLDQLPKGKEYVAYCRGPYCVYADTAVELLIKSGRRARRLAEGFPEWKAAGHPVEIDASNRAAS
jgi:rhodanese-related sulfurtransferase/biotin operon repressor